MNKLSNGEQKIVLSYMKLANERAKYYYSKYKKHNLILELDDFESFAYEGLCYAVKTYDKNKNCKLKTHIINCIRYKVKTYVVYENSSLKLLHNSKKPEIRKEMRSVGIKNSLCIPFDNIEIFNTDENYIYYNITKKKESMFEDIDFNLTVEAILNSLNDEERTLFKILFIKELTHTKAASLLDLHINTITIKKKKLISKVKKYL